MRPTFVPLLLAAGLVGSAPALATPGEDHPAAGTWHTTHSVADVRAELDDAIDDLAIDLHVLMREVARGVLSDATKVCGTYDIAVGEDTVAFACDDHPPMLLSASRPTRARNGLGVTVEAVASVRDDAVVIRWSSDAGTRTNTFRRTEDGLELRAHLTSRRLPRPLHWTVHYHLD